jgi:hypothetical protein
MRSLASALLIGIKVVLEDLVADLLPATDPPVGYRCRAQVHAQGVNTPHIRQSYRQQCIAKGHTRRAEPSSFDLTLLLDPLLEARAASLLKAMQSFRPMMCNATACGTRNAVIPPQAASSPCAAALGEGLGGAVGQLLDAARNSLRLSKGLAEGLHTGKKQQPQQTLGNVEHTISARGSWANSLALEAILEVHARMWQPGLHACTGNAWWCPATTIFNVDSM